MRGLALLRSALDLDRHLPDGRRGALLPRSGQRTRICVDPADRELAQLESRWRLIAAALLAALACLLVVVAMVGRGPSGSVRRRGYAPTTDDHTSARRFIVGQSAKS